MHTTANKRRYLPLLTGVGVGLCFWLLDLLAHLLVFQGYERGSPLETITDLAFGLLAFAGVGIVFWYVFKNQRVSDDEIRKLSRAVEQSASIILITDLKGRIEYANPKFTEVTGYTLDEVRGKNPRFMKSGRTPREHYAQLWQTILAGEEWHGEFQNVKKSGEIYWELTTISPVRNSDGVVTHFVAIKEDITGRKRVEVDEREQRVLAEALRDTAAVLNSDLNLPLVLERILENVERVVPHDAANIMLLDGDKARVVRCRGYDTKAFPIVMNAQFSIAHQAHIRQLVTTKRPYMILDVEHDEEWTTLPDTEWIRAHIAAPICQHNEVIGILSLDSRTPGAFSEDQLDRLMAFADQASVAMQNAQYATRLEDLVARRTTELEHEQARLHAIMDAMGEGVLYVENDDDIIYINESLKRLLGYAGSVHPTSLSQLYTLFVEGGPDYQQFRAGVVSAFASGQNWHSELGLRHADGSRCEVALTTAPVYELDGERRIGSVTLVRDISQQKQIQIQKDRFLAHVAHELRTPIANLITRLYLLQHQPEKLEHHRAVMEQVTGSMKNLIDDLLQVLRADPRAIRLVKQPVVLQEIIHKALDARQHAATGREITLVFDEEPAEPLPVCADRERIMRVMLALLDHAISATMPGGQVSVRLAARSPDWAVIEVQDEGPALEAAQLVQVFEPFFSVTDGEHSSGVALGLAVARDIVRLHGGDIVGESLVGRGNVFSIRLALIDECADQMLVHGDTEP